MKTKAVKQRDSDSLERRGGRFERTSGPPGLQGVLARNVTFPEPLHLVHAEYVIKLTLKGSGAPVRYRGTQYGPCSAGSVTLVEPFEPVVSTVSNSFTSFLALLVDPHLLTDASGSPGRYDSLRFVAPHIRHQGLASEIAAIHADMTSGVELSLLEERTCSILQTLLGSGSQLQSVCYTAVQRARDIIMDRIAENVSLAEMEMACGVTRFHLSRMFRQRFGLPPHEFRTRARVAIARNLLVRGLSQADVAIRTGFFDQSHMHRHFGRVLGIGPGVFQRSSRK